MMRDIFPTPGEAGTLPLEDTVEQLTQELGRKFWSRLERRSPSIFERRWWDDRLMAWFMADELVKVQAFRFIDVLPTLRSGAAVTRHLREYFAEVGNRLPTSARLVLRASHPETIWGRLLASAARRNALRMARRFIAGTKIDDVLHTVSTLRKQGLAFTLDLLGEAIISETEADAYQRAYLDLIGGLSGPVNAWPEVPQLDRDEAGPIPRVNISLKLSALYSQFNPGDPRGSLAGVQRRLKPILRAAREQGAYVHVDMEHYAYKDLTLAIFKDVLGDEEFRDFRDVGIVVQVYLPEAERDLHELRDWAEQRGTPIWVRLVKGAYWDYETVAARARSWPLPVYQAKWQSDDCFERQARYLLEHWRWLRPAFGSHNLRSLTHALAWADSLGVPRAAYEIQMLYGMAGDQAQLFAEEGRRVRIYTPFGDLIPGMAYLVRRLLENTSNDSFLKVSFSKHASVEDLLMKPATLRATTPPPVEPRGLGFVNEPHTDFSRAAARTGFGRALAEVQAELGATYPLVIDGVPVSTAARIESRNPSHAGQIVGHVASASQSDARAAIQAARGAFRDWSRLPPHIRADYLDAAGNKLCERRFELAAWEVYECGKPWAEADADVAEAIDFCRFYAAEMRRLGQPRRRDVPGEENAYFYRPRGVAVVIAPWNFPLAILTGMTAAALVTGNTVIMKPAEQSPVIAAKLMDVFREVGIPNGVVNYLPGVGEEIGPTLVESTEVDLIAFTGSRGVGLAINRSAAEPRAGQQMIKRVIAELGGKNAIIVDDDANLDEAVLGVMHSAFAYAGQKCSACSRAIVLETAHDEFVGRLVEATRSLQLGPAEEPGTAVGPVIDEEARRRILEFIEIGKGEGRLAYAGDVGAWSGEGCYVAPHIFTEVAPRARIAQEEIFGPVLAVLKARDFDDALAIANDTSYALTGGVYSRSPGHLQLARAEFEVGNLYLNRTITGALVDRHPFGGFKMSGIGSKAGGPDYLQQFLIPVNVTENTLRRGFAPPEQPEPGPSEAAGV